MTDEVSKFLDRILELDETAAETPWGHWPEAGDIEIWMKGPDRGVVCTAVRPKMGWNGEIYGDNNDEPTADLIVEYRTAAPKMAEGFKRLLDLAEWHETKAYKARNFRVEINGGNPVMDKEAKVHEDAANMLREIIEEALLDGEDR